MVAHNSLSGTEKVGSTNNLSVQFFVNSAQQMPLAPPGNEGIGTASPKSLLHIAKTSIVTTRVPFTVLRIDDVKVDSKQMMLVKWYQKLSLVSQQCDAGTFMR